MNCAIYVDADNVSYKNLEVIVSHANNSNIIIKKIYADWTQDSMKKWAAKAKIYGFQGIQCFGNEKKQTSDIYMITDIVNDLYSNEFIDMVLLATSDIDFTHLCHLIKQKNKKLVIFTPQKSNITSMSDSNKIVDNKNSENEHISKKVKIEKKDKYLFYLTEAMKDSTSIYISKYKKNLRKIVKDDDIKAMDINHIDKLLCKYPKHFKVIVKGNKIKIYGLFHLHKYSQKDFLDNKIQIEEEYNDIFKVIEYNKVHDLIN